MKKKQLLTAIMSVNSNLSAYTLNNLSAYTLKNLSADTLNNLSADTLNNLSADTLKNLSADTLKKIKLLDALAPTPNFYTDMLKGIEEKKLIYKQSTFGEIADYDPKLNVCESPMCIAGHHVHAGGKAAYDAKKVFGYAGVAGMLHLKTYPDAPIFDYMKTDNGQGMAYIEMMAEFEQRKNKKQTFAKWYESALKSAE